MKPLFDFVSRDFPLQNHLTLRDALHVCFNHSDLPGIDFLHSVHVDDVLEEYSP